MNSKLLIIIISGLAAIGGLFLFSPNPPPLESQSANVLEAVATPTPSKLVAPKIKPASSIQSPTPILTPSATATPTFSPTATPVATRIPAPINNPTSTPAPTPIPTPSQTFAPTPIPTPYPTSTPSPTPTPEPSTKININTANSQDLQKINGIGPVIAQRIIDYRNKNGPFQTIEDLKKVNGIGDLNFQKMKNQITI